MARTVATLAALLALDGAGGVAPPSHPVPPPPVHPDCPDQTRCSEPQRVRPLGRGANTAHKVDERLGSEMLNAISTTNRMIVYSCLKPLSQTLTPLDSLSSPEWRWWLPPPPAAGSSGPPPPPPADPPDAIAWVAPVPAVA